MSSAEGIEKELAHFNEHISHFNQSGNLPFSLSMSIGYALLTPSDNMDVSTFIKLLDNLMYDNKREYYATHKKKTIIDPIVEK